MIKFFRKIRQNLLLEGKTGKYLKYAIGEIVLIVIGILIALQLNNINEEIKIEATRQGYYSQLLNDLNKDKVYIEKTISFLDSLNNEYNAYLETYKKPDLNLNQVFGNQIKLSVKSKIVRFNTNTIESLENTGEIKLIPTTIRNKLSDLKRNQNLTIKISDENSKITTGILKSASLEFGSATLSSRLVVQPKLTELLKPNLNYNKVFILLEAHQEWKNVGESITLIRLKKILSDEDILVNLITEELKK